MTRGCLGCMQHSSLLTNQSSCYFCRRLFQSSSPRQKCRHQRRAPRLKLAAKKQEQDKMSKLQRANQSTSQASNPDATLSNYLHFGRLIGEQPAEIEAALNSKSVQYERDLGADEYLERWQAEGDPTYAMMEALLQGSGPGANSSKSSKLKKAKSRVSNEVTQFAKEAMANAKKLAVGRRNHSLLRAKPQGPGLKRPPRLPADSAGASVAKPSRRNEPALMSRPKPPVDDEMRWQGSTAEEAPQQANDAIVSNLPPPALSYEDFDMLLGNMPKKGKKAKSPDQTAAVKQAQNSSPASANLPKLRPPRSFFKAPETEPEPSQLPYPTAANISRAPSAAEQRADDVPALKAPRGSLTASVNDTKRSKFSQPTLKASPSSASAAEQLADVSLKAPPRGFADMTPPPAGNPPAQTRKNKLPAPSLIARPRAPSPSAEEEEQAQPAQPIRPRDFALSAQPAQATEEERTRINTEISRSLVPESDRADAAGIGLVDASGLASPPAALAVASSHLPSTIEDAKPDTAPLLQRPQRSSINSSSINSSNLESTDTSSDTRGSEADSLNAALANDTLPRPRQPPSAEQADARRPVKAEIDTSKPKLCVTQVPSQGQPSRLNSRVKADVLSRQSQQSSSQPNADTPPGQEQTFVSRPEAVVLAPQLAEPPGQEQPYCSRLESVAPPPQRVKPSGQERPFVTRPEAVPTLQLAKPSPPLKKPESVTEEAAGNLRSRQPKEPKKPVPALAERPARPAASSAGQEKSVETDSMYKPNVQTLESAVLSPQDAYTFARKLMVEERQLPVVVVAANAGGVLVTNRMFKAFMPLQEMTSVMGFQVLSVDAELTKAALAGSEGELDKAMLSSIRRKAMRTLRGSTVVAKVIAVDRPAVGPRVEIIMSCKKHGPKALIPDEPKYQNLPEEHIKILQQNVGTVVQGTVVGVRPYGCFVAFDVEAESGNVLEVYGMVHLSEIAWDFCKDARLAVQQLDVVEAKLIGLDPGTGKVWLSMRQVHPDPLQDTLDSLLAEDLLPTGGGDLLEYPVDDGMEDEESYFPEAEEVARSLVLLLDVDSVQPGRRSTADPAVPSLQVHLAKPALEVTAPSTANDREAEDGAPSISRSGDEHDSDSRSYNNEANASGATFSDDAPSSAPTVESTDDMASVSSGMSNNSHSNNSSLSTSIPATATDGKSFVGADHADAASQDTNALEGGRGAISDEDTDDTIASSFDWVDDCDSTVCTLVVQKGQQQQELLVSGGITRQQLVHEVDNIVSMLSTA